MAIITNNFNRAAEHEYYQRILPEEARTVVPLGVGKDHDWEGIGTGLWGEVIFYITTQGHLTKLFLYVYYTSVKKSLSRKIKAKTDKQEIVIPCLDAAGNQVQEAWDRDIRGDGRQVPKYFLIMR